MLQKLITLAICQPHSIARQTNVAKGETLSMMDSSVLNEMLLLWAGSAEKLRPA